MDRPGVRQVPESSGEQWKMEKTGCKIICGAPTTLAVKGLMMIMMMIWHAYKTYLRQRTIHLCFNCFKYLQSPHTGRMKNVLLTVRSMEVLLILSHQVIVIRRSRHTPSACRIYSFIHSFIQILLPFSCELSDLKISEYYWAEEPKQFIIVRLFSHDFSPCAKCALKEFPGHQSHSFKTEGSSVLHKTEEKRNLTVWRNFLRDSEGKSLGQTLLKAVLCELGWTYSNRLSGAEMECWIFCLFLSIFCIMFLMYEATMQHFVSHFIHDTLRATGITNSSTAETNKQT